MAANANLAQRYWLSTYRIAIAGNCVSIALNSVALTNDAIVIAGYFVGFAIDSIAKAIVLVAWATGLQVF